MSGDRVYCYPPDYTVIRNKLDLRDAAALDRVERRLVSVRMTQDIPSGAFDLAHLRAIHHHLFQDVYEWAGALRTVEISKGGNQFQLLRYIETGMADVHRRLVARETLRGLSPHDFAQGAGEILGDVNYVHSFREGNGRTQLVYLRQLARQAGHDLDLRLIDRTTWMEASHRAHQHDFKPMAHCIAVALAGHGPERDDQTLKRPRRRG